MWASFISKSPPSLRAGVFSLIVRSIFHCKKSSRLTLQQGEKVEDEGEIERVGQTRIQRESGVEGEERGRGSVGRSSLK